MKNLLNTFFLCILFFISNTYTQQFTEQTSIVLTGVNASSVKWGDFDNDGDLDILLTGQVGKYEDHLYDISYIGINNGDNTFTQWPVIAPMHEGSVDWGDYDNDGDLDILLTGKDYAQSFTDRSIIYKNNGDGTFTEQTSITLTGVSSGSGIWGDYDNDGNPDILLTGSGISKIYKNNGDGTFTEQSAISLTGISDGSGIFGDYDNDKDLDILLSGSGITIIYKNNGDETFSEQTSISLSGITNGTCVWGDYDNDGDLDILLTGSGISKIYKNNGDSSFTEQTAINLIGLSLSSAAWGDYDNDGNLDVILTGVESSQINNDTSLVYKNNGDGTFTEQTSIFLTGVADGSVAWGDYDNDGDLDLLLTGEADSASELLDYVDVTKIYRNDNITANTIPNKPANLTSQVNGQNVTLSWDKSYDNETPQDGLTYNLVIGTSPDSMDIISPMSNRNTGYRRVVNLGNTNCNTSWTVKELGVGEYYWSVQAIDNGFLGSEFATEQYFSIPIPVELISFNAKSLGNDVVLEWSTATETNNYGFEVQRANKGDFNPVGFVIGQGTKTSISNYGYVDRNLDAGKYFYKLKQIDLDGNSKFTRTISVEIAKPLTYSLSQNYPNPFNPSTVIKFSIPEFSHVKLTVYNQLGEIIEVITERNFEAGSYTATWNAKNQASGLYFYEIKDKNYSAVKKAVIVR